MKIVFDDEFEEYLFARWADYLLQTTDEFRMDLFQFEEEHKEQILAFYEMSKVNKVKSEGDYQKWLLEIKNRTLH